MLVVVSLSQLHVQQAANKPPSTLSQVKLSPCSNFWPFAVHGGCAKLDALFHCIFKQIYLQFSACGLFPLARKPRPTKSEWFCAISWRAFKWREN